MRSLPYSLGDVFAVPLRDDGFALGVVARTDGRGIVLGYFFGPRLETIQGVGGLFSLKRDDAVRVCRFGDHGLVRKMWPVIGKVAQWEPTLWPVPVFCRSGNVGVSYHPESLVVLKEENVDGNDCRKLPEDGLEGSGFVEVKLTRILASSD